MSLAARLGALAAVPLIGGAPALALVQPHPNRAVAIVHAAGATPALIAAIGAAGGAVLAERGANVTFAYPLADGFSRRLQGAGPWLVLDAAAASFCLGKPPGAASAGEPDPGLRNSHGAAAPWRPDIEPTGTPT